MKKADLQKCILGMVSTNCYFLKNKESGELLIIDPAADPEKIKEKICEMQGKPVGILLTHGHYDHILAAEEIRKEYGISIYACREEKPLLGICGESFCLQRAGMLSFGRCVAYGSGGV